MAEVMHFYGMSFEELVNLSLAWFCKLFTRISQVEARHQMSWMPIYAIPHIKEGPAQRLMRDIAKKAQGKRISTLPNQSDESSINRGWFRLREQGIHAKDAH